MQEGAHGRSFVERGGAGQPISKDRDIRSRRAAGLYRADRLMPLQKSQDNHLLHNCYDEHLGEIGGHSAHELLHTAYQDRSSVFQLEEDC